LGELGEQIPVGLRGQAHNCSASSSQSELGSATSDVPSGTCGAGAAEAFDTRAELFALRIEAANLLDHALRLRSLLKAERKSVGSRTLKGIKTAAKALRSMIGRRKRRKPPRLDRDTLRCAAVLRKSGLFDEEYYLRRDPNLASARVDPAVHYVQYGASEMRDPGPYFKTWWYIKRYPDVAQSGQNPLYHFIVRGYAEGRQPTPPEAAEPRPVSMQCDHSAANLDEAPAAWPAEPGTVRPKNRLVVYTAVFGDYDELFIPSREQADRCDFVIFTDQPDVPPPWRRGAVCYAAPTRVRQNRFYKLLPHRLFPDHEWSLYLDGNIDIRMDPLEFLDRYCDLGPEFFVFRHPRRSKVVEELAACIELRKDDAGLMLRQVARYLESGFRQSFALTENNVLLRRHNEADLVALSEAWWEEVRSKSHRDQLSLSFVLEKTGYQNIALFEQGRMLARHYPGLGLRPHRARAHAAGSSNGAIF
jgi:hypothetical protein